MSIWEAIILGLVQGLTEYLPVSSSGHLEIGNYILGTAGEENLLFTTTVHAATVLSTIVILWKEIWGLIKNFFRFKWNDEMEYLMKIFVSMIPILIVGLFFKDYVESFFGNGLLLVGCMLLLTAVLLGFTYIAKPRTKEKISWRDAFIIGLSQACAVLPGLSRSGTTIATGLLLGNKKENIAQFSFIMVIIPILGEMFLNIVGGDFAAASQNGLSFGALAAGFITAFVSGCLACKWMLNIVKKGKLIWFAIYCACAGILAIVLPLF